MDDDPNTEATASTATPPIPSRPGTAGDLPDVQDLSIAYLCRLTQTYSDLINLNDIGDGPHYASTLQAMARDIAGDMVKRAKEAAAAASELERLGVISGSIASLKNTILCSSPLSRQETVERLKQLEAALQAEKDELQKFMFSGYQYDSERNPRIKTIRRGDRLYWLHPEKSTGTVVTDNCPLDSNGSKITATCIKAGDIGLVSDLLTGLRDYTERFSEMLERDSDPTYNALRAEEDLGVQTRELFEEQWGMIKQRTEAAQQGLASAEEGRR
jgi:hypothetical protein